MAVGEVGGRYRTSHFCLTLVRGKSGMSSVGLLYERYWWRNLLGHFVFPDVLVARTDMIGICITYGIHPI